MTKIDNSLKRKLTKILGKDNYNDTLEERICYAYDGARKKKLPDAVLFPRDENHVSGIMKVANEYKIPVIPRGAGSGMTGGAIAINGGIILVMTYLNRIIEIDVDNMCTIVEPGVITSTLHNAVEEKGLFYPPDPGSRDFSTIGGNIAENAGGMRAVKYGVTKDYVMGLEVILPSGDIIHTGSKCIKDVVGYNLTDLFVGSEGTLGIITKATLKLIPLPESTKTLIAAFPTMNKATKTVTNILNSGIHPATIEFMDEHSIRFADNSASFGFPENAKALLLIETDGESNYAIRQLEGVKQVCIKSGAIKLSIAADEKERNEIWKIRRAISPTLKKNYKIKLNEDIVVPRSFISNIIEKISEIGAKYDLSIINFGHAGDGNIHVNVLLNNEENLDKANHAVKEIFDATIGLGGRISGEHGIGLTKKEYIGLCLEDQTIDLMKKIKCLFDPNSILNPGKIFPDKI